jgi:hypothetical protein
VKTIIPGQCDFVWHVEKGKEVIRGKPTPCSFVRTQGSPFIMASSTGFDDKLDVLEPLNFDHLVKKMGLQKKGAKRR